MSAAACRRDLIDSRFAWIACWLLVLSTVAGAQTPTAPAPKERIDLGRFLAGAAVALGAHETGHIATDLAFGKAPGLKKVSFSGIPFLAITHPALSPAREFVVSSAGFWVQDGTNEIWLSRRPRLRREHAPFAKGMLAFNILTSAGYAGAAFARTGPFERDTRGMAAAMRLGEPWMGGLVLTPAVLDAARYYAPETRWLRWAGRASKAAGVLFVLRAAS